LANTCRRTKRFDWSIKKGVCDNETKRNKNTELELVCKLKKINTGHLKKQCVCQDVKTE
jgi:hypothetical protein